MMIAHLPMMSLDKKMIVELSSDCDDKLFRTLTSANALLPSFSPLNNS